MKCRIGEILYMPYDGSRTYFMITSLSFLEKGKKAFLLQLPLTKDPKSYHADSNCCSDFSIETNNLEIQEKDGEYYVELPDSIFIDQEKCSWHRSSRWEYGKDLYYGLYYLNETLENPAHCLEVD